MKDFSCCLVNSTMQGDVHDKTGTVGVANRSKTGHVDAIIEWTSDSSIRVDI